MEDIAAMVAEAIARRARSATAQGQAQLAARAQAGDPNAQALLDRLKKIDASRGGAAAAPAAPPADAPAAKAPAPMGMASPPARLAPGSSNVLPDDGLPGLPLTIFDEPVAPRPPLLQSFSGTGLLAGIVLSEALARPVALREGSGTLF